MKKKKKKPKGDLLLILIAILFLLLGAIFFARFIAAVYCCSSLYRQYFLNFDLDSTYSNMIIPDLENKFIQSIHDCISNLFSGIVSELFAYLPFNIIRNKSSKKLVGNQKRDPNKEFQFEVSKEKTDKKSKFIAKIFIKK